MNLNQKIIVFDIDGTLANCEHRRHYVRTDPVTGKKNRRWDLFNKGIPHDSVYQDLHWLFQLLMAQEECIMLIATGRNEENREETTRWLTDHDLYFYQLYMRKSGDHRDDAIVKFEILEQIKSEYGTPYLWFDDRTKVVNAIRKAGIRVLQVQPGDF
jgi:FMN phosphatase YigB (HAD superfamily)